MFFALRKLTSNSKLQLKAKSSIAAPPSGAEVVSQFEFLAPPFCETMRLGDAMEGSTKDGGKGFVRSAPAIYNTVRAPGIHKREPSHRPAKY